jgi:release factor glutamine methyltransferase
VPAVSDLTSVTVRGLLREATDELAVAGCESPGVDAELLLAHALDVSRSQLSLQLSRSLDSGELESISRLVERRARREPLQHVLGTWGFRRLVLKVDGRALIPRPETEAVVERCLALLDGVADPLVLDVGTGSGAIALAIADEHAGARVTGIDVSVEALELARENSLLTGLEVELGEHDLFRGLPPGPWDLVVSNPPYVAPGDRAQLQLEVREWEPPLALYAVDAVPAVARGSQPVLRDGGALVLEVGDGQAGETASLLTGLGFLDVRVSRDLSGRERVVEGRRPGE